MNKKEQNIENRLQEALSGLDGLQRATPGPFFYTRVKARLSTDEWSAWETVSRMISRPVVAITGLCLVVLINMFVIFSQSENISSSNESTELALADQYTITPVGFFDNENLELR